MFNQNLEKMETMTNAQEVKNDNTIKTVTEEFDVKKNAVGVEQHNKGKKPAEKPVKAPKVAKPTLASIVDTIIAKGGTWESMIEEGNTASKKLGMKTKFTAGTFKTQIHWRINVQGRKTYLTEMGMTVTEKGIEKATSKKAKK